MLNNFTEAAQYLENRRPLNFDTIFAGQKGLNRVKKVLELLGNPQEKVNLIHIAGTSGKSSTAYFTSKILETAGFKVGLMVSPSIYSILERFQINSANMEKEKFVVYLNQIIPILEQVDKLKSGSLNFFEVCTILAFYVFAQEKVDYAVVETGLGGLFDATNTVKNPNKIVILTSIDFDHTEILGNKISQIGRQKAGIIHAGNTVFSALQKEPVTKVIYDKVELIQAKLFVIREDLRGFSFYTRLKTNEFGTKFNFHYSGTWVNDIILSQIGSFQAQNCGLALAACAFLASRNSFEIDYEAVKLALRPVKIPARNQLMNYQNKQIFLDLARNPHQVEAMVSLMQYLYPGHKFTVIFAATEHKDTRKMFKSIGRIATNLILTEYQETSHDISKQSQVVENLKTLTSTVKELANTYIEGATTPLEALEQVQKSENQKILVIGSNSLIQQVLKLVE